MPVLPNDVRAIGEADAKARVREPRMFANPIVVGTTVIRMKRCRIRNEISLSRLELACRLALMLACLLRFVGNTGQDVRYGKYNMAWSGWLDFVL